MNKKLGGSKKKFPLFNEFFLCCVFFILSCELKITCNKMRIFLNLRKNNKKNCLKITTTRISLFFQKKKWKKTEDVDKKSPFGKLKASAKKEKK